jgi:hypothetical protein
MWLLAVARSEACRLEVGAAVGRERVHCRRAHNMTVIPREVWAPCDALEIVASSRSSQTWKLAVTLQTIGFSAKVCASRYTTLRRKESRRRWWRRWRWGTTRAEVAINGGEGVVTPFVCQEHPLHLYPLDRYVAATPSLPFPTVPNARPRNGILERSEYLFLPFRHT